MEQFIPEHWIDAVQGIPVWGLLLAAAAALYILSTGADWLVDAATGAAVRIGIPKIIVGATIVSLGTTTPECAVSVTAAWKGDAGLALGNSVGSVIADTALIFGLGCVLVNLPVDAWLLNRQGWLQFGVALLLALYCYAQYLRLGDAAQVNRPFGIFLLLTLAWYLWQSVQWSRQHARIVAVSEHEPLSEAVAEEVPVLEANLHLEEVPRSMPLLLLRGFIGLLLVIAGSEAAILFVTELAERLGVPEVVISGTLVAFGTSLPELIVGMTALRRGHPELLVGNIIGADILNILFVTGAAAVAEPLPLVYPDSSFPLIFLLVHLPFMIGILLYFRICIFASLRRGHFQRWMGIPLLVAYLAYTGISVFYGRG